MLFVIDCRDKPGHESLRKDTRQAHLEYLATFQSQLVAAGPTLSDDGEHMTGSFLIMDFADRLLAERFAANDPYAKAGLFETVSIRRWRRVLPKE
ncbi:MAG: YciI family protein [Rhodospirillales bacterium]|nr:MAG: YciI family protein [Rhodospirillales bacterium]